MSSQDSERFHALPPLLVGDFARLPEGSLLNLALLVYVEPNGHGAIFRVKYTHRELQFRTPGGKDAVAFGVAALEGDPDMRDVRILFSQVNETATLKGLTLLGSVKPIGPNKSLERARKR